jgi:hypothetical protein
VVEIGDLWDAQRRLTLEEQQANSRKASKDLYEAASAVTEAWVGPLGPEAPVTPESGPAPTPPLKHDPKLTPMCPNFPDAYPAAYRKLCSPPPEGLGRRPKREEVAAELHLTRITCSRYRKATGMPLHPI